MLRTAQRQGWGSWVHKLARVSPVLEWFVSRLCVSDKRCGDLPRHFLQKLDVHFLPLLKASMDTSLSQSVGAVATYAHKLSFGQWECWIFLLSVELDRPWPTEELFAKTVGQEGPGAQTT